MNPTPYIDIHTHARTGVALEVVCYEPGDVRRACDALPHCLGIHPWRAAQASVEQIEEVENARGIAAVGEIGLDYACRTAPAEQQRIFELQLELAQRRGLPVVIHCVRAFEALMATLRRWRVPGVLLHGFIGSPEQALRAAEQGYRLSFSPGSLRSPRTVEALRRLPAASIFAESDVSGVPVARVYDRIAELRGTDVESLKEQIMQNYRRLLQP